MARSLKKGPFADASLLKKIDAMNTAGQHQVLRPGPVVLPSSHRWLDTQLQFMMEESTFRYMLQKIWLDINSVNSLQPEPTEVMAKTRRNPDVSNRLIS